MMTPFLKLCLTFILVVTGCGRSLDQQSTSLPKVVGPHVRIADADEFPNTVAIRMGGRPHCTGTLVAPNLVITAAHCVHEGNSTLLKVHTGRGTEDDFEEKGISVISFGVSPNYQKDIGGNSDVAYLILAQSLDHIPIIPIATKTEELRTLLKPGATATIVGFGTHDNDLIGSNGVKYLGPGTIKFSSRNEVWIGDTQGDGCSGDSGGPAYGQLPDGSWRSFGVTSRGPSPCGLDEWPGIWGLMHAHICWIERSAGIKIPGSDLDCLSLSSESRSGHQDFSNLRSLCEDSTLPTASRITIDALRIRFTETSSAIVKPKPSDVGCDDLATWAESLATLDLSKMMLSDLRPLKGLKKLQNLNIEDNFLTDVSSFSSGFESLKVLHLGWNDIQQFSSLDPLMANGLRVYGKGVQSGVQDFSNQKFEVLCHEATLPEADLSQRNNMDIFRRHLCYNRLCSCSQAARNLKSVRIMDLSGSAINTLEPLRGAIGLQQLKISDTNISDLQALATVENLRTLEISGSKIADTTPLENLISENSLNIIGNSEIILPDTRDIVSIKSDLQIVIPEGVSDQNAVAIPFEVQEDGLIQSLSLTLDFEHQNPSDLIVRLVHPSGKYVNVARRLAANGPRFQITFSFGQEGIPTRSLSALKRMSAQGQWKLLIHDTYVDGAGKLLSAELKLSVKK